MAIDATEFPDLVRRYNVNGVPKTVINDTMEIMGAAPEQDFIAAIARAAAERPDAGTRRSGELGFAIRFVVVALCRLRQCGRSTRSRLSPITSVFPKRSTTGCRSR